MSTGVCPRISIEYDKTFAFGRDVLCFKGRCPGHPAWEFLLETHQYPWGTFPQESFIRHLDRKE